MKKTKKIIIAGLTKVGMNGSQYRTSIPPAIIKAKKIGTETHYFNWTIRDGQITLDVIEK